MTGWLVSGSGEGEDADEPKNEMKSLKKDVYQNILSSVIVPIVR